MALRGEYNTFDGVIITNSCDIGGEIYDKMERHSSPSFSYVYFLTRPNISQLDAASKFFKKELEYLKESLEDFAGVEITESCFFWWLCLGLKQR